MAKFKKAALLLDKVEGDEMFLSGGIAEIKGVADFAGLVLEKKVVIYLRGRYFSAIGATVGA